MPAFEKERNTQSSEIKESPKDGQKSPKREVDMTRMLFSSKQQSDRASTCGASDVLTSQEKEKLYKSHGLSTYRWGSKLVEPSKLEVNIRLTAIENFASDLEAQGKGEMAAKLRRQAVQLCEVRFGPQQQTGADAGTRGASDVPTRQENERRNDFFLPESERAVYERNGFEIPLEGGPLFGMRQGRPSKTEVGIKIMAMENFAKDREADGKFKMAAKLREQALELSVARFGEKHKLTQECQRRLNEMQQDRSNQEQA
jgi:hypothetical protein